MGTFKSLCTDPKCVVFGSAACSHTHRDVQTALFCMNVSSKKVLVVTDKGRLHCLPILLMTETKFTNEDLNSHFLASFTTSFLFSFTC